MEGKIIEFFQAIFIRRVKALLKTLNVRRMGVSGFLISCATCLAISCQACSRSLGPIFLHCLPRHRACGYKNWLNYRVLYLHSLQVMRSFPRNKPVRSMVARKVSMGWVMNPDNRKAKEKVMIIINKEIWYTRVKKVFNSVVLKEMSSKVGEIQDHIGRPLSSTKAL